FAINKPIIVLRNLPAHCSIDLTDGDVAGDIGTFGYIDEDFYPAHFFRRDDGKIALCGTDNDWYYDIHGSYSGFQQFNEAFDKARQARFEQC
ncbi:MAG: hypothetical protein II920_04785, partial [Clostridia bacterium]|nr:hypothetical protein [Clostridia bacterium]